MPQGPSKDCSYAAFLCGRGTFLISVAVLVLFILNCGLIGANRAMQSDIVDRQTGLAQKNAKIAQDQAFGQIYQGILQALGNAAVNKKDEQIKKLLDDNGLKIEPVKKEGEAPAAAAPAAAPPAAPAKP